MSKQNEFNAEVFRAKGLGGWRQLYLAFINHLKASSVVEFGAGDPALLAAMPDHIIDRQAIDGTDTYRDNFISAQILLDVHDLDKPGYPLKHQYDIAVCSDVFEHLVQPQIALELISQSLTLNGLLFAHVPNEFTYKKTLRVMLGREEAIYSHPHCAEFNHPHLHRFTDIGFRKFLSSKFKYLIKITELRYSKKALLFQSIGRNVPYCLEGGPTYICTNSQKTANEVELIKRQLLGNRP